MAPGARIWFVGYLVWNSWQSSGFRMSLARTHLHQVFRVTSHHSPSSHWLLSCHITSLYVLFLPSAGSNIFIPTPFSFAKTFIEADYTEPAINSKHVPLAVPSNSDKVTLSGYLTSKNGNFLSFHCGVQSFVIITSEYIIAMNVSSFWGELCAVSVQDWVLK